LFRVIHDESLWRDVRSGSGEAINPYLIPAGSLTGIKVGAHVKVLKGSVESDQERDVVATKLERVAYDAAAEWMALAKFPMCTPVCLSTKPLACVTSVWGR
jgi:hypothetical protein